MRGGQQCAALLPEHAPGDEPRIRQAGDLRGEHCCLAPNLLPALTLHLLCSVNVDSPSVQASEVKVSLTTQLHSTQLHSGSHAWELARGGSWNNAKWFIETQCVL